MINRKLASIGLSALSFWAVALKAQAAGLVQNGSFESFTGGQNGQPSELADPTHTGTGYTTLTNWTNNGYAFLIAPGAGDTTGSYSPQYNNTFKLWGPNDGSPNGLPATSPDGGNYIAADGATGFAGSITQTITTNLTVGNPYTVSFFWAAAQQYGYDGATDNQWQVSLGGQTQSTPVISIPSHGFSGWKFAAFTFTADARKPVLSFLAVGNPSGLPPFALLDGVGLAAGISTPEAPVYLGALVTVGLCAGLKWKLSKKK